MNVIVTIEDREAIPVRAIPLLTNWEVLNPDEVAQAIAGDDTFLFQFLDLRSYRIEDGKIKPIGVIEFDGQDEATLRESIEAVRRMRDEGLDLLNVSINFVIPDTAVPWASPGFMAPIAERVRQETGLPVASSWCLDGPQMAEQVVAKQQMDLVMIGRAHLANPHYPRELAHALGLNHPDWVLPAPYAHWLSRYSGPGKASAQ